MIKKLRKKIILTNMLLVGLVLLIVFGAMCVNSWRGGALRTEQGLRMALDLSETPVQVIGGRPEEHRGGGGFTACVVVTADGSGAIAETRELGASIEEDVLREAVAAALASQSDSGSLGSLGLRYVRRAVPADGGAVKLAFADSVAASAELRRDILTSAGLFIASMAVLFAISLILSRFAVKPVDEAWTSQRRFVADASHELKTPLTVILANNSILRSHREESVASQSQWLESTEEEARRMRGLVEQLLTLARTDEGRRKPVKESLDLSALCQEELLSFEPVAFDKGVALKSVTEPGVMAVSDPAALRQAIEILLDNALKYAPPGTEATVSLAKRAGGAEFSVTNLGEPIAPEDIPHIFDRFYRGDKARSEGGYGLGLAIAKGAADSVGASLSVRSSAGSGTTFTLRV